MLPRATLHIGFLERKNQETRFFLSKSMPNFNFAKVQLKLVKNHQPKKVKISIITRDAS